MSGDLKGWSSVLREEDVFALKGEWNEWVKAGLLT
jgi:hypothetical protein